MTSNPQAGRGQRGVALVIGLLLLVSLTLLALGALRSGAAELIMAGNQQFTTNAFQAAETGIERAYASATFNPAAPQELLQATVTGTTSDNYRATTRAELGGNPQSALWGNSWNSFATYHFSVQSVGQSRRSASATTTQGVIVMAPFGPAMSGSGALN